MGRKRRQQRQEVTRRLRRQHIVRIVTVVFLIGITWIITRLEIGSNSSRVLYAGKIVAVADDQWTDDQCLKLKSIFKHTYPVLVKYFGEPSEEGRVTVNKTKGFVSANVASIGIDKQGNPFTTPIARLELSEATITYPSVVAHELAHYFHNRSMVLITQPPLRYGKTCIIHKHDAFEEGMAQAAMELVRRELGYGLLGSEIYTISEGFNKPQFSFRGSISNNELLYPIRQSLASWSFLQWEAKHPGFIRRFNEALYKLPDSRRPFSVKTTCLPVAERITPGFSKWYETQYALVEATKPGVQLFIVGESDKLTVGLFERARNGGERGMAGETVQISMVGRRKNYPDDNFTTMVRLGEKGMGQVKLLMNLDSYSVSVSWRGIKDSFSYP